MVIGLAPKAIILPSSRAVYGEGAWTDGSEVVYPGARNVKALEAKLWDPQPELLHDFYAMPNNALLTKTIPVSVYGATKLCQENCLTAWSNTQGITSRVYRLQNVYGPGQSAFNSYTGITTLFVRMALEGRPIPIYEDGQVVRDFVFIDDVVERLAEPLLLGKHISRLDQTLDIGSGVKTTLLELAETISNLCSSPKPVITGQFRLGDVRSAWSSSEPGNATPLASGLKRLIDWMGSEIERLPSEG